ncbi:hypothetical protein GQR58_023406 [Nymphon striatum]|nr:hypothetical protein GQR58_023406 [Nymphon striatum]
MKFQVERQTSVSSSRHKVRLNSPPTSLQDWLDEELERRGIDAVIYTRYILSILLQDSYDVDSCQHNSMEEDICSYYFCNDRKLQNQSTRHKHYGRKNAEKFICYQHQMGDHEQRKKSAAVECLKSVSEEMMLTKEIKSQQPPDEVIDTTSSFEEQAKKYYAAFPALSGKSTDPVVELSILSESSDMIVEKSAWMSGGQSLFNHKDFLLPNEEQKLKVEEIEDEVHENKPHKQTYPPKSSDSKLSLIVPKVRYVKTSHSRLNTVITKNKPPKPFRLKQDASSKFMPIVSAQNEDDEILAKFIDKFNTENIAAIWDKMFQPQYLDSVLNIPELKDTSFIYPNDYQQKYISVWSTKSDSDDPLIFSNNARSYCHDSDGPRRFSLTLSDESDDLCSLSHIFHETTSKELDNLPELEKLNKSSNSFNETSSIHMDDAITTTSLNFLLPSEEYVSLVMCTPSKKSPSDSLLTSERTHFRPIRQESLEKEETVVSPVNSESKYSLEQTETFLPLEEDISNEENPKHSDSEENESRDSWSPDMKDCFSTSPVWPACAPASDSSNSLITEFDYCNKCS